MYSPRKNKTEKKKKKKAQKALAIQYLLKLSMVRLFLFFSFFFSGRKLRERLTNSCSWTNTLNIIHQDRKEIIQIKNVQTNFVTPLWPENLEHPKVFIHRFQCYSAGTFTPVGLGKQQHLWEMGKKMEKMWCERRLSLATAVWKPKTSDQGSKMRKESSPALIHLLFLWKLLSFSACLLHDRLWTALSAPREEFPSQPKRWTFFCCLLAITTLPGSPQYVPGGKSQASIIYWNSVLYCYLCVCVPSQ